MKKISRYFKDRVASLSRDGIDAYGKFSITIGIKDYIEKYSGWLVNGQLLEQEQESLAGRIMGKQKFKNDTVYDLRGGGGETIQLKVAARNVSAMKHGDIVGVTGFPARGNFGELIFNVEFLKVLAPCLHQMPDNLKQEARVRKRFLDLNLHKDSQKIFETRAKIISYIRSFLDKLECQEVETPILNSIPGVGAGCPFSTNYKDLKLYLRVAPELNLKKLVVGGFDRVYEIGKQFRNEGIDPTHNPEFTSCEVYMTYTDYEDMVTLTEDLLSGLVKELTGSFIIRCQPDSLDKEPVIIDFSPPFRRMGFLEELEKVAGLSIPRDLDSAEANNYLKLACERLGVECKPPHRTARLLDKLIDNFLVPSCVNPTFIIDHPRVMSVMAKSHKSKPEVTERFELYVNKQELCNAYTELNDPMEQRQRFAELLKELEAGDSDAQILDDNFCEALEYGLPPTAGWGIGIDRLVMLLTYTANIKDVLLFPLMRPVSSNRNSK